MVVSVNTNTGAMIALQNLNSTSRQLDFVQNRINTGLQVNGAKDNSSIYAIAQNMRGDIKALTAVSQSVARATSITDVAMAAGESVSDLLVEMRPKLLPRMIRPLMPIQGLRLTKTSNRFFLKFKVSSPTLILMVQTFSTVH